MKIRKKREKKFDRYTALTVIMILIFSYIIATLVYLQIVKGNEYRETTSKKSIRNISITPPRGDIIDRSGNILAQSRQGYALVFTETNESKEAFFKTMIKVFNMLDENKEIQKDDFELKINPYRFEFKSDNPKTRRWMELRLKKDRGMDEVVIKELFGKKKKKQELTKEEKTKVDEELLKKTPEEFFKYLLDLYKISDEENKLIYTDLFNILKKESGEKNLQYYLDEYDIDESTESRNFSKLYKAMDKDNIFDGLVKSCNINTNRYSVELKRRIMLVKDSIKSQSFSSFKPVVIASNIKRNSAFIFMQKYQELPGIEVTVDPTRVYPNKELGSIFLGYLSKINSLQEEKYEEKGYDASTDYIGAAGIEGAFESTLKGSKGTKIVQINKYGRIMRELGRKEPYPGKTVQLTIDKNIQHTAEEAFEDVMKQLQASGRSGDVDTTNATRGAAVAIDVKTGQILAMVSKPSYDPNLFAVSGKLTPELQKDYFSPDLGEFGKEYIKSTLNKNYIARETYKDKSVDEIVNTLFPLDKNIKNNKNIRQDYYDIYPKPLYNYATKSLIPPGSTFKPLTAVAGLEEGVVTPNETMNVPSMFTKHGYKGKNFNSASYSNVNITKALEKSINYFFFEIGDRLYQQKKYNGGFDAIAHYAWKFGLGAPAGVKPATGIEINERFGQVYNLESGRKIFSSLYMNSLVSLLSRGTDTRTPNYNTHYIGIDIKDNIKDEENIRKIKENLRNRVIEEMKYKKEGIEDIKPMVLQLSQIDNKIKNKYTAGYNEYSKSYSGDPNKKMSYDKFVQDQVEKVTLAMAYSIDDANFNINNQNNVYDASIGQGTNQFTPVQMANYIATLVNGGKRYKVHLVDKILDQDGKVVKEFKPEIIENLDLDPNTIETVKAGMRDVITEGTARTAFLGFPIANGGKTGSATFSKYGDNYGRTSYGVYVGFAPFDNPEIAVCAVVFDGGHGGWIAPVARAIYEEYFKDRLKKEYPNYVPKYNFSDDENSATEKTESEVKENIPEETR